MAKKTRGPVISDPFTEPKQETITIPAMIAAPALPNIGICCAAVAATRSADAIADTGRS